YRYRINGGNRNVLSQSARQPGDAVLSVKLALMRVAGPAIFTGRRPARADAVQSLIEDHPIAASEIRDLAANFFNAPADFMSQNLRLDIKRNRLSVIVSIVVGVSGEDMRIGAAQADCRHPDEDLVRTNFGK